jgi:hypothetical protein
MTDAWPSAWSHNKPLFDRMIEQGFSFKWDTHTAYFVDKDGKYVNFPAGYVTGPSFNDNGSPRPCYASTCLGGSWVQYSSPARQDALEQALERARLVLQEAEQDE